MLGPIFLREWRTTPRRPGHFLARGVALAAIWVLLLTVWQTTIGWERVATLGDRARFGRLAFRIAVNVELALSLFFAALSAANAIAQEKDRRTFLLLLATDLRGYEIVLGKTLGGLLGVGVLLACAAPLSAIAILVGGVAPHQVAEAYLILAATALAAACLGGLVALWRDKTFQSLALTVLLLVLYPCLIRGLGLLPRVLPLDAAAVASAQRRLDPFLALESVVDPSPDATFWDRPTPGFAAIMLAVSAGLSGWGIVRLRAWNPSGEPIVNREIADSPTEADRVRAHAAPGPVRRVWDNPILWREIATRAYGRRPMVVKCAYAAAVGLICYAALAGGEQQSWAAARGLVPVAVLSLLLLAAQAVTSITSERDLGSFDLLMVTDLSPREFVFGKIGGILYNAKEYLIPPLILIGVYVARGQFSAPATVDRSLVPGVLAAIASLVLAAFVVALGLHVALRAETSRLAISHCLGAVVFLSVGVLLCIYLILMNGSFEYQWLSFSAFIAIGVGGLWWILCGDRPSAALSLASWLCPCAVFYAVSNVLIGKPGGIESADPLWPFLVAVGSFGFATAAMLVPLLGDFDVAIGRASAGGD